MKFSWLGALGAFVALVCVQVVLRVFGMGAALTALGLLLAGWLAAGWFYRCQLRRLRAQFAALSEPKREQFLARMTPDLRADFTGPRGQAEKEH